VAGLERELVALLQLLGPSALENEDLVLAYASILAQTSPPYGTDPEAGQGPLVPLGTAYLRRSGSPLIPPPAQFFEAGFRPRLLLPPPASVRWPWALLLAALAALKLGVWSRLSGKALVARD
jgi:hypothetical protein